MTHDSKLRFTRRRLLTALAAGVVTRPLFAASGAPVTSHESRVTAQPVTTAAVPEVALPASRLPPPGQVRPRVLVFPRDHGSHPDYRVEWWYVTGLLEAGGAPLGFQITFFRARLETPGDNPSAFAPRQMLIGHAALSDPRAGRLLHQQRVARAGFGLADAATGRTQVWIDRWRLEQTNEGYAMVLPVAEFGFELALRRSQPLLLNGEGGYSRKGPRPESASHYYSIPQLAVRGTVTRDGRAGPVVGRAWLDHEWSSSYLDERAQGWDWIGINLDDGGALMAFRIRSREGTAFWAGGTWRTADGRTTAFAPAMVTFEPLRDWRSPRTGTRYPVAWTVRIGGREYRVEPLFDDQEQDARATTGTVYWEGAVELKENGRRVGAGYLELTGYWRKLRL